MKYLWKFIQLRECPIIDVSQAKLCSLPLWPFVDLFSFNLANRQITGEVLHSFQVNYWTRSIQTTKPNKNNIRSHFSYSSFVLAEGWVLGKNFHGFACKLKISQVARLLGEANMHRYCTYTCLYVNIPQFAFVRLSGFSYPSLPFHDFTEKNNEIPPELTGHALLEKSRLQSYASMRKLNGKFLIYSQITDSKAGA